MESKRRLKEKKKNYVKLLLQVSVLLLQSYEQELTVMNWKRMLKAAAVATIISTGQEALKPCPDSPADWLCL